MENQDGILIEIVQDSVKVCKRVVQPYGVLLLGCNRNIYVRFFCGYVCVALIWCVIHVSLVCVDRAQSTSLTFEFFG